MRGLGSELGGALGPQGGGEYGRVLNLAQEGVVMANLEEKGSSGSLAQDGGSARRRPRCAQVEGKASPRHPRRLATLAGRQAACLRARTRRCARGGRAGQGAGDPYRVTVGDPYPLFSGLCEIQPKFELESNLCENKSCSKFYKLQIIFWWPGLILSRK